MNMSGLGRKTSYDPIEYTANGEQGLMNSCVVSSLGQYLFNIYVVHVEHHIWHWFLSCFSQNFKPPHIKAVRSVRGARLFVFSVGTKCFAIWCDI